jgi:membrane fusion protein, multidrug efflux system
MKLRLLLLLLPAVLVLTACGRPPAKTEEIRPVRTITVGATPGDIANTYAGEVRPRYESDLGFRVSGKILSRAVNMGDVVKNGQVLSRLDAKDLALNEASGRAQLAALDAQLAVAKSDYDRNKRLYDEGVIGQAGLDHYEATYRAAQAQVQASHAQLDTVSNQTGYAELRADHDGVITAVMGEPGQVVTAGQAVVRLAHSGEIEIASSIPEDQIARMHTGMAVEVSLWAHPDSKIPGLIRELASSADPATRTYAVRVSVPQPPPEMKLGMTAAIRIPLAGVPDLIHLPLAALVEQQGQKGVWVYDPKSQTVAFRPIGIAGAGGNDLLVGGGLHNGDIVVTAGAPLLLPGQKVKLLPHDGAAG